MQQKIIFLGLIILLAGLTWPYLDKLPLFRLPGDYLFQKKGFKIFLPLTTCIVISAILSIILNIFRSK